MSVEFTIDGRAVAASEGTPLVQAAAAAGVYIPTLCHLPGRPSLGTCRVCSVRVNGRVTAACTVPVAAGMTVEVAAPDLADMRLALVEALFAEGNHNCPGCEKSGRCELQAVAHELGMTVSRFPYRFAVHEPDHAPRRIWLERDRCILCQRCVAFVRDRASGRPIFTLENRGVRSRIAVDRELADAMAPEQVREAVRLCPVGCILEKGVGYDEAAGRRRFEVRSIRDRALGRKPG